MENWSVFLFPTATFEDLHHLWNAGEFDDIIPTADFTVAQFQIVTEPVVSFINMEATMFENKGNKEYCFPMTL